MNPAQQVAGPLVVTGFCRARLLPLLIGYPLPPYLWWGLSMVVSLMNLVFFLEHSNTYRKIFYNNGAKLEKFRVLYCEFGGGAGVFVVALMLRRPNMVLLELPWYVRALFDLICFALVVALSPFTEDNVAGLVSQILLALYVYSLAEMIGIKFEFGVVNTCLSVPLISSFYMIDWKGRVSVSKLIAWIGLVVFVCGLVFLRQYLSSARESIWEEEKRRSSLNKIALEGVRQCGLCNTTVSVDNSGRPLQAIVRNLDTTIFGQCTLCHNIKFRTMSVLR